MTGSSSCLQRPAGKFFDVNMWLANLMPAFGVRDVRYQETNIVVQKLIYYINEVFICNISFNFM